MVSQRRQEQVGTYLSELGPKLQEMDGLFSVVVLDGRLLADLLRKPPTDSSDPGLCVHTNQYLLANMCLLVKST